MAVIRILHLSDLHLAGRNRPRYEVVARLKLPLSVYQPDVLLAVSEIITNWRNEIDGILITGDIATTCSLDDLIFARDILSRYIHSCLIDNKKLKHPLEDFNKPVIIVPGNHDRFTNLAAFPGNNFYQIFSSSWYAGIGGVQIFSLPNSESPLLSIISTDFSLEHVRDSSCWFGHFGQGKVYHDRLKSLILRTEEINKNHPYCSIIWMIHFAPQFERHYQLDPRMVLVDSNDLIESAEKVGVKYIFCGHTHQYADYTAGDGVQIHCAGTSTCIGDDQNTTIHLRLIELSGQNDVCIRSLTYFYDPERQVFSDSL